jgi:hypothetical protein
MDPNAIIVRIRELTLYGHDIDFAELASLIADLDQWMSQGNTPPADWAKAAGTPLRRAFKPPFFF